MPAFSKALFLFVAFASAALVSGRRLLAEADIAAGSTTRDSEDFVVAYVTAPHDDAPQLAEHLVDNGLAACVNILPGMQSVYKWKGKVEREYESLMIIKTRRELKGRVTDYIHSAHPYDVPEVVFLPIQGGSAPYMAWIQDNTHPVEHFTDDHTSALASHASRKLAETAAFNAEVLPDAAPNDTAGMAPIDVPEDAYAPPIVERPTWTVRETEDGPGIPPEEHEARMAAIAHAKAKKEKERQMDIEAMRRHLKERKLKQKK